MLRHAAGPKGGEDFVGAEPGTGDQGQKGPAGFYSKTGRLAFQRLEPPGGQQELRPDLQSAAICAPGLSTP